jgi:hypothetical protein
MYVYNYIFVCIMKNVKYNMDMVGMGLFLFYIAFISYFYITEGALPTLLGVLMLFGITMVIVGLWYDGITEDDGVKLEETYSYALFFFLAILGNIIGLKNYVMDLNMFSYVADFSTLMGFPKPGNDTMFSIIALLSEMTILLTFILFGVLIALAYIIDVYNADSNPFPRHFEKSIESTLDVLFVVFPTAIIIYLLVPSLGFIFNNETAVETVFDLDIIGHQWYWSYEYSLSIGITLYDIFADENTLFNRIEFDSLMDL